MLVVEDDLASAQALKIILRRHGWDVSVAATLAEANAYLDARTPDTIILDLMLPDGEGATILQRVREAGLQTRVAVTTASTDPDRIDRVTSLKPDAFLHKPIELSDLLKAI